MGEEKFEQTALVKAIHGTVAVQSQQTGDLRVDTPGGIFQVRWEIGRASCRERVCLAV